MNKLLEKLSLLEAGIIGAFEAQNWRQLEELDDAINIVTREVMEEVNAGSLDIEVVQAQLDQLMSTYRSLHEKTAALKTAASEELGRLNQEQRAIKNYLNQYK